MCVIQTVNHFCRPVNLFLNRGGTLGFQKTLTEEPDEYDEQLPTPKAPPPSWIDLNVETDLDVLLHVCFEDIQNTLTTWAMVVSPRQSSNLLEDESSSRSSTPTERSFQIIPLIQSVTKMLDSVRNYITHRHDLSDSALSKLRGASLSLLEVMKNLESHNREDGNDEEGYLYKSSEFDLLGRERQAIHTYLRVVESQGFNPPHRIGSPPAVFTPEIQALIGKTSVLSLSDDGEDEETKMTNNIPLWLQKNSFPNDPLGKNAFI